jgi:hypothetical protein
MKEEIYVGLKISKRHKYIFVSLTTVSLPVIEQQATSPLRCLTPQIIKCPLSRLIILRERDYNLFKIIWSLISLYISNIYVKSTKQNDTAAIPSRQITSSPTASTTTSVIFTKRLR